MGHMYFYFFTYYEYFAMLLSMINIFSPSIICGYTVIQLILLLGI